MSEEILRVAYHIRSGVCFLVGVQIGEIIMVIL